jgi:hypothetical protein
MALALVHILGAGDGRALGKSLMPSARIFGQLRMGRRIVRGLSAASLSALVFGRMRAMAMARLSGPRRNGRDFGPRRKQGLGSWSFSVGFGAYEFATIGRG